MFNSRSDVIFTPKKFTWTIFGGIYPIYSRRYVPGLHRCESIGLSEDNEKLPKTATVYRQTVYCSLAKTRLCIISREKSFQDDRMACNERLASDKGTSLNPYCVNKLDNAK